MLIKHTRKLKLSLCLTIDYFKSDTSLSIDLNIISKFSKRQKKPTASNLASMYS